jgi:hypothetical protein
MPAEYRLDRFANVFWAGHDLVWAVTGIIINLDIKLIAHGMKQTLFHLEKIGFEKNPAYEELSEINKEVKKLSEWDFDTRKKYADRLLRLRDIIGAEIAKYQKDYATMPLDKDIIPMIAARAAK